MLGTKVFVEQDYHSLIGMNHTKNHGCESIFIAFEVNKYIVYKCVYFTHVLNRFVCPIVV